MITAEACTLALYWDLQKQKHKFTHDYKANSQQYLTAFLAFVFVFLILSYFGPFEDIGRFGSLTAKRLFSRAAGSTQLVEAEAATLSGPMTSVSDTSASGGSYIVSSVNNPQNPTAPIVPASPSSQTTPSAAATPSASPKSATTSANLTASVQSAVLQAVSIDAGSALYSVNIANAGNYTIWTRMWGNDANSDSFWLSVDGAVAYDAGDGGFSYNSWQWVNWIGGNTSNKITVSLTAGTHSLKVFGREANTRVDRILLTTDLTLVPTEFGDLPASPNPAAAAVVPTDGFLETFNGVPTAPTPIASATPSPSLVPVSTPTPTSVTTPSPANSNVSKINWLGQNWNVTGANIPWFSWSCDFGCNGSGGVAGNQSAINAGLATLKNNGAHVARWWVFPGDPWQITRDSSGAPSGINPAVYADFDAALNMANANDIYYDFVLFSAPTHLPSVWVTDSVQRIKLANVLGQLFAHYKNNPRVMTWEIFNEPEYMIWNNEIGEADTVAAGKAIADSVHANSSALVTVGHAMLDGIPMWKDANLDYYSPHWYDVMNSGEWCAICTDAASVRAKYGVNKPIVIGEAYLGSDINPTQRLSDLYGKGYAGVWGWSLFSNKTNDGLVVDLNAIKSLTSLKTDIGPKGLPGGGVGTTPTPTPVATSAPIPTPTPTHAPSAFPANFNLLAPANNAANVSANPLFDWVDSTGSTSYWIYVADASAASWSWARNVTASNTSWNNGSGWVQVTSSSPSVPATLPNASYKWWVVARNASGDTWATPGAFTFAVGGQRL